MGEALHQATVTEEYVGVMIDDLVIVAIELRGEHLFRERHADGVGKALPERPRGRLDADVEVALRVPGGARAELAELAQFIERKRIARQVQQRVEQHRRMAVRQHETVAVDPAGVGGIVLQHIAPEHLSDVRHAHRGAGMT